MEKWLPDGNYGGFSLLTWRCGCLKRDKLPASCSPSMASFQAGGLHEPTVPLWIKVSAAKKAGHLPGKDLCKISPLILGLLHLLLSSSFFLFYFFFCLPHCCPYLSRLPVAGQEIFGKLPLLCGCFSLDKHAGLEIVQTVEGRWRVVLCPQAQSFSQDLSQHWQT